MIAISRLALTLSLILVVHFADAQETYFEVVCAKGTSGNYLFASAQPLNNQPDIIFKYQNKTKQQLLEIVRNYLKSRPALKLDTLIEGEGAIIVYRDFATVCAKEKCFADLTALSYIYVVPENGMIKIRLGMTSKIFATIFDAKLRINPDGLVASDGDLPFNEYKIVQPANERVLNSNVWMGTRSKKREIKSAYPDSIFDPEGKIINAVNKKIIETFYDGYVIDLKTFIDKNLK